MTALHRDDSASLSEDDFSYICQFVYKSTGIVLNGSKREMVYRRLTRIVRERKIGSFSEYCRLLRAQSAQEESYFINAITTNLTSFFREQHHFDYLSQHELPKLLETKKESKRIRIWSSASSTGEEPYSIAVTLLEALGTQSSYWDAKILATDIDSNVVAKGKAGVYSLKNVEDMPKNLKNKYFKKGRGEYESQVRAENIIKELITFKQLNLLDSWPMQGPFDIIFCRNVLIYFDKKTQSALFERYYNLLAPGGLLLLGHSESLGLYQQYFENVGRTIFRKPF